MRNTILFLLLILLLNILLDYYHRDGITFKPALTHTFQQYMYGLSLYPFLDLTNRNGNIITKRAQSRTRLTLMEKLMDF